MVSGKEGKIYAEGSVSHESFPYKLQTKKLKHHV